MKTILILFFLVSIVVGQQDTVKNLEKEILSTDDTEIQLLGKSRRSLLNAIRAKDLEKAKEIFLFTQNRFEKDRIIVFWEREEMLIQMFIGGYDSILTKIRFIENEPTRSQNIIRPPEDLFFDDLKKISKERYDELQQGIRSSVSKEDEREFLLLFLDFLTFPQIDDQQKQFNARQLLNQKADEFLRFYSSSPYVPFVRNTIRFVIVQSDFGFGYSLGLGQSTPTAKSATLFSNAIAIMIGYDMTYKDVAGFFTLSIGVESKTRQMFSHNGTWNKDLPINIMTAGLSGGYVAFNSRGLRIMPNLGIGFIDYSPPEIERKKPGNDVSMSSGAYIFGLQLDVPISTNTDVVVIQHDSYVMIRMSFQHYLSFENDPLRKGGLSLFTISFGIFGHSLNRDL